MRIKTPNVKGFSIIEVIASLFILTLALGSILLSSLYANIKAEQNFHYRAALLKLHGEMEEVQCIKQRTGGRFYAPPGQIEITRLMNGKPLRGNLTYRTGLKSDMQIGLGVRFTQVELILTWKEAVAAPKGQELYSDPRSITLREDFYFRDRPF